MKEEQFAIGIRSAGNQIRLAERALARAEADEKQTYAMLMFQAQEQHGCKTNAAQVSWAERQEQLHALRIKRGVAKGMLAAARANLLAAEVEFKQWQSIQAQLRAEQRVYGA